MSKLDFKDIVNSVQKLYAKDKKAKEIINLGSVVKTEYTLDDVIPLPENHPFVRLSGLPGLPFNKIVQFAGKPDSGKSTAAAEVIVAAQRSGAVAVMWETEDKFDAARLTRIGGVPEEILFAKTNEILKGGELVRKYVTAVKDRQPDAKICIIWDSAGGSQSRSHAERILDDERHAQPGQDAKEIASVMKAFVALINKYPDSLAFYIANQTYAKIGFMQKGDSASGGTKLEFHSSFIVFLKRIKVLTKKVKGMEVKQGIITRATVYKNHLSASATSVYKMDFEITANGYNAAEEMLEGSDDGE